MTKQELIDYCFMYWQHISKKMLDLMKGFPCKYVDNKLGYHSLTYGRDADSPCALNIIPEDDDVYLHDIGYKFHYDYVEKNGYTYLYDEIDNNIMDRFIGIVLYIAHHEYEIMQRPKRLISETIKASPCCISLTSVIRLLCL